MAENRALWSAFINYKVSILVRHAYAPELGDLDHFHISKWSTQRNLNNIGRIQAQKIGNLIRSNRISSVSLYSSAWRRCLETANLMKLGSTTVLPFLNSFFQFYEREKYQTKELRNWLVNRNSSTPAVLVTHKVNITALTGILASSGELVFVRSDSQNNHIVLGTIETRE